MRPLRLYIKNFMNHNLTEIEINFNSVLIVGKSLKNEKISNGVGKTTIFRAIEYVLFNQSYATTLDKIVQEGKKKAIVEYDFELEGEIYRIYRHRCSTGSSDVRLYKKVNGVFDPISGRTATATDEMIRNLLKISHKAFTYSVLFRQADLTGITAVDDPKKRKDILKEPLNLIAYTKLEELAAKKSRPLKKEIDRIEGSISVLGDPDTDIVTTQKSLSETLVELASNKEKIDIGTILLEQKRGLVDDLKQSLGSQDVDVHKKVSEQEHALKRLRDQATSDGKRLSGILTLIESKENKLKKIKSDEDESNQTLQKLFGLNVDQDIEDIQVQYKKVCADEMRGNELLSAAKTQLKFIKKSLPEDDKCPSCYQSITSEYRSQITENINNQITKQQDEIDRLEDALGKCRRKKSRLENSLQEARTRINEINKIESTIKNLVFEQKNLREEIDRLFIEQKDISVKIRELESQISESTTSLSTLKEIANTSTAPEINKKIFEINQEISIIQSGLVASNGKNSTISAMKGRLEERISTRTADKEKLAELKLLLEKLKHELKFRQIVVDAFSTKGIPNFIIQTVIEDLQTESNKALRELRPELEVKITSDLDFEYRRNGILRDYNQLSHGQQVYIALAFKRGLSRVIQKKLNIAINTLYFDEVDAHLDDAGVEAFADAIRKWQKDLTIFVITHNKELKDKFSQAILVEEGENGAEGKLVSNW